MLFVEKGGDSSWHSHRLAVTLHVGGWLMKLIVFLLVILGLLLISKPAAAMFVSSSEEEESPRKAQGDTDSPDPNARQPTQGTPSGTETAPEKTLPGSTGVGRPGDAVPPEDINVKNQMRSIYPVSPRTRKVNSRTFARMSGETRDFKPVATPIAASKVEEASLESAEQYVDPQEKIFSIGSWIFILVCVGAAAVGLLRIRRLLASG